MKIMQVVGNYAEWSDPGQFGGERDGVISTLWNSWGEMLGYGSIVLLGIPTWSVETLTGC